MRQKHWAIPALAALTVASVCIVQQTTSLAEDDDHVSKVSALLKQRRETLHTLVKLVGEQYRAGQSTFDSVIRASDRLSRVELELAQGHDARLAIHKQRVELLTNFEKMTDAQFRAGEATQEDVLIARAERLGAEIELLKAEAVKP